MGKRKIFDEIMEGVAAMEGRREGKITLRSYKIEPVPLPAVDSKLIRDTRKRLRCSRAVFARKLRINERTLEKWEQGRAKPNPQAAALVLLVRRYPDTLERLEQVAAGQLRDQPNSALTGLGKSREDLFTTLPEARERVFARRYDGAKRSTSVASRHSRRNREK